jgi:ketosteroid isomerase-like protein
MPLSETEEATATIERFNDAINRRDLDAAMEQVADDVVFENTSPPPDGERIVGRDAMRAWWAEFLATNPRAHFEPEEIVPVDDRVFVRWRYTWGAGHVRGVDLFRVREGLIVEKLAYVKG